MDLMDRFLVMHTLAVTIQFSTLRCPCPARIQSPSVPPRLPPYPLYSPVMSHAPLHRIYQAIRACVRISNGL